MSSTFHLTKRQRYTALQWLVFWHIIIIIASNYLVQIPVSFGPLTATWGTFTFPFIFLTTDLTTRIFGRHLARRIIFWVMFPALILSYVISVLFHDGKFSEWQALSSLNVFVLRIAIASFSAYIVGQLLDITLFNRLRQNKRWWVAPSVSTIFGNAIDTLIFYAVAFFHSSDAYMQENWVSIGITDYTWKLVVSMCVFLPAYGWLLKMLISRLTSLNLQHISAEYP